MTEEPVTPAVATVLHEALHGERRARQLAHMHLLKDCSCSPAWVLIGATLAERLTTNGGHAAIWWREYREREGA